MTGTSLFPQGGVAATLESAPYVKYACGSSHIAAPSPKEKLKHSLGCHIKWAELKFPPLNLWVMASLSFEATSQGETAHIHRRQRPGLDAVRRQTNSKKPNALHKLHRRLESLLAVRGGKV